jgi:AraC-like DNA-binding protein
MPWQNARVFAEVQALINRDLADREAVPRTDRDSMLGLLAHLIESQCKKGDTSIRTVASRLGMTVHGLRQQLKEHNVAYDEFVLCVRQTAAMRHIESSHYDLTTIALILGYSDLSAFSRSFKRWYGRSPSACRNHASKAVTPGILLRSHN